MGLSATYQLFITFGILVACTSLDDAVLFVERVFTPSLLNLPDCIAIGTRSLSGASSWRTVVGIGLIWPAMLMIGIQFMPESPR